MGILGHKKVNVFTMAYNVQETLGRAIESILGQTFGNLEYYILDNGSEDNTWEIILQYAELDKRIIPLNTYNNDPTCGWAIFRTIINATDADYIVWCDADDAYTLDFLENMIGFAEENRLDIAACGYDKIRESTGKIEKHKALEEDMVIYGDLFAERFIEYRGFISYLWGKLYHVPFLKKADIIRKPGRARTCNDTIWTLNMFRKAERIGIHSKAMYHYYQYHDSFSHRNIEDGLNSYRDLWSATKEYLEHYGPISRQNEDFLYAIYLSLVEEATGNVFSATLNTKKKLVLLARLFDDPVWMDTLKRDADPMLRNLAAKKDFVNGVKEKIMSLPGVEVYPALEQHLLTHLEVL